MCECPCINVLSVGTSSYLNVETEPEKKWCGDGESEPMGNLHLGNRISASAIMKKSKNGHHFINMHCMEVWVSSILSVNRNGILVSDIIKKSKNGCHFINMHHMEKFQITNPPKFGSAVF